MREGDKNPSYNEVQEGEENSPNDITDSRKSDCIDCRHNDSMEFIEDQSIINLPEEILQNISMESPSEESFEIGEDGKRRPAISGRNRKLEDGRPDSKKRKDGAPKSESNTRKTENDEKK